MQRSTAAASSDPTQRSSPTTPVRASGSRVFHRHPREQLPIAVAGDGPYIIDSNGKRYLDASGGAAVSCLGHSHRATTGAIQEQVATLAFAHTRFFSNEPMEDLARVLADDAPAGLDRVYFVSGGSEGIEAALKLCRQYHLERGEPQRRHVIARRQSYHGNTLGALAAGGNANRRAHFEPLLTRTTHIAPCYPYRDRRDDETLEAYGRRVADELEAAILALGEDAVICFLAETVAGATLGAVPAVPGYFRRVREICDRYGVLFVLDEVMCGMGRTGTLYACEQEGVTPDVLVIAKGLGAGYQPIGAVLASRSVYETIVNGSGFFHHGHTYHGHATACAAALAVQRAIKEEGLLEKVRSRGVELRSALEERFGDHPHIGDIRGRGLFLALELVSDRDTKRPFDPAQKIAARVKTEALESGLICYPMSGLIDGQRGDHVMLAPPFIVDASHLDEIVDKLSATLDRVLSG
jgi:adenosylmethionine-8-amino-7-oxononanoate aminotransferase